MARAPRLRRALPTASFFITLAAAQACYYPDGSKSTDIPCGSGDSACCGENSFCMNNGLCYTSGVVSRGSCTDKTWDTYSCAGYCRTVSPSSAVSVTPCLAAAGANTFACGLESSSCANASNLFTMFGGDSFILRPSQVAALVQPALSSNSTLTGATTTVTASANTSNLYTPAAMAGLGFGLAIPLLIATAIALTLYRRTRSQSPKLMYALPDEGKDDDDLSPPPPFAAHRSSAFRNSGFKEGGGSDTQSLHTLHSAHSSAQPPAHMLSFMERYQVLKENLRVQDRVELEADGGVRHELGDRRSVSSAGG